MRTDHLPRIETTGGVTLPFTEDDLRRVLVGPCVFPPEAIGEILAAQTSPAAKVLILSVAWEGREVVARNHYEMAHLCRTGSATRQGVERVIREAVRAGYLLWALGDNWREHYFSFVYPRRDDLTIHFRNLRQIPRAIREAVFERDGNECVLCGSTERLHLDHIDHYHKGGEHVESNLRVLCAECNLKRGAGEID